ncbi:MAG: hypothetical protein NTV34_05830 [Proteobacteria bacterium]|nr:hypothetical protein [Pseudomonadota bacterium]
MSQVIVTDDKLNTNRKKSLIQEHKIDREGQFNRWRRNDITGFDPLAAGAGLLAAPVVMLFWAMSKTAQAAIYFALIASKILGKIIGPMKSP